MKTITTVYVALSLTHVKTNSEREEIRRFLRWIEEMFSIELLLWAFDVDKWQPKPVDDVYQFDSRLVKSADLAIFLYLSNDGSDGRGGELVQRTELGKPLVAFARRGVRVSRYPTDCLKSSGVELQFFDDFIELQPFIAQALRELSAANQQLLMFDQSSALAS